MIEIFPTIANTSRIPPEFTSYSDGFRTVDVILIGIVAIIQIIIVLAIRWYLLDKEDR